MPELPLWELSFSSPFNPKISSVQAGGVWPVTTIARWLHAPQHPGLWLRGALCFDILEENAKDQGLGLAHQEMLHPGLSVLMTVKIEVEYLV